MASISKTSPSYANKVLKVEPYGIEAIPLQERHGNVSQIFTFWFSANLNILTWFTGALGIILGLSFPEAVGAVLLGNVFGTLFLAITSAQGPSHGLPQIAASGRVFGPFGLKLFGILNWLSNVGWFAVDIVLGVGSLQQIFHLSYLQALLLLGSLTIGVAVIGYNFIHRIAQISALALGAFFLLMSFRILPQLSVATLFAPSHLPVSARIPVFILAASAVFAYQIAFCTAGSDFSRYLQPASSPLKVGLLTFLGSASAGIWLEILGAAVTSLNPQMDPIALIVQLMGLWAIPSLLTVAVSTIPVNVLAVYTGGMSLLAAGFPLRRWLSALLTGGLGMLIIASGNGAFADAYKNFLLLLSYWIAPWVGIFLASEATRRRLSFRGALILYFVSLAISIPFMASSIYTGYISLHCLGGADIGYLVGLIIGSLGVCLRNRQSKVLR